MKNENDSMTEKLERETQQISSFRRKLNLVVKGIKRYSKVFLISLKTGRKLQVSEY